MVQQLGKTQRQQPLFFDAAALEFPPELFVDRAVFRDGLRVARQLKCASVAARADASAASKSSSVLSRSMSIQL